jgi:cyclopropane fatty-acyl-phospholipid synthase-like methyltransferase
MVERFDRQSKEWDALERRVVNAKNIAKVIAQNIDLKPHFHLGDLGAGTGLLSGFLADKVSKITALDNSKGMLEEFLKKDFSCVKEAKLIDITKEKLDSEYDGIISSMTIHHIEDTKQLFQKLHDSLKQDGFIAIADLDVEDGSFHSSNEGVFHYGFDFEELEEMAKEVGFGKVFTKSCGFIQKPHKSFEVKCLIGKR